MRHPSTRHHRPGRTAAAIAAALALALAACSGADDTDNNADAASDGDTAVADAASDGDTAASDAPSDGAQGGSTAAGQSGYLGDYELVDEEFGTMVTVTVDGGVRTIETNALPDHETGEFPNGGNPNAISAQDLTWEFPAEGTFTGDATEVRMTGVAVNGVKFEPGTAETISCDSGETYRIEALQELYDLGLDFNNAHVQPTGEYHYHGISELLVDAYDDDADLVHIGFASDGYLIYYSKSGAYASSYVLSDEARTGAGCVASGPAGGDEVDLAGSSPDGTYTSDYVYTEGAGDLDACNGTTIDGIYAYVVTDAYPYVARCLNGEPSPDAGGGGGGAGPGGAGPGGPGDGEGAAPGRAPGGAAPGN